MVWQRLHLLHAANELFLLSKLLVDNVAFGAYARQDSQSLEVKIFVLFQLFEDVHRFLLELCVLILLKVIQEVNFLIGFQVFAATRTIRADDVLTIEVK